MNEKQESIKDTLLDLMGYSLIGLAMQDGQWEENGGIHGVAYRTNWYEALDQLFARKLADYGTKDLGSVDQIAQRMHEKLYRIENLLKGKGGDDHKFRIKKHDPSHDGIMAPQRSGDAGYDLVAFEDITVKPAGHGVTNVKCGFSAKLPAGFHAEIKPRSSGIFKLGIEAKSTVLDEGFTGEWFVALTGLTQEPFEVKKGMRIAQCVLAKNEFAPLAFVETLPETERGTRGFGSTGV